MRVTGKGVVGLAGALLAAMPLLAADAGGLTLLLSADTEGQIAPCQVCPAETAPGGMARRATLINERRRHDPALILLDAGNALFGGDSMASGGEALVSAYNLLAYDAVNLSYRDFRLGKARTLRVLRDARFAVVSCNVLDATTGQLIARPYIVKQVGSERIAIVGVTAAPATRDMLPHLAEQLAGVRVREPLRALAEWLPTARRESDRVVLLFYGSATALDSVRGKFGGELAAILAGGIPGEAVSATSRPAVVTTTEQGKRLASVRLLADGAAEVRQLDVAPSLEPDPRMEELLKRYGAF
jgi:2',3'-cyclic-nucleotide 2'-phosphodiesterase (5'-nucleotidase family)